MMSRLFAAVALTAVLSSSPCLGGIHWHKSYEDALKVAKETGRPMVVVIVLKGNKNVTALKKLFVKPKLGRYGRVFIFCYEEVEIVNNSVSSRLFAKFRPQGALSFPCFYFVGPDEKLLGQMMGSSARDLGDMLMLAYRKHGKVADPKTLKAALSKLKEADALHKAGNLGRAASLYQQVASMEAKAPPIEAAKAKLAEIEKTANQQLEDARADLKDKSLADAIDKLTELDREFGSLDAGKEAHKELARLRKLPEAQKAFAELERRASEAKAEPGPAPGAPAAVAEADGKIDGFTDEELDALDALAQGAEAPKPSAARAADVSKKCRRLLGLSRNWIANKQPDKAKRFLQQIIDEHPETLYADQARAILDGLK